MSDHDLDDLTRLFQQRGERIDELLAKLAWAAEQKAGLDARILELEAEVERLRAALFEASVNSIVARNPGIDEDEVRASLKRTGTVYDGPHSRDNLSLQHDDLPFGIDTGTVPLSQAEMQYKAPESERCGGSRMVRRPDPDSYLNMMVVPCPGCPDCQPPLYHHAQNRFPG